MVLEFRVLGSLEVVVDGAPVDVASSRERALLALLLVHANRPLSPERILDEIWGDDAPASGPKTVAFHVYKLRGMLEPGRGDGGSPRVLLTEPGGYVLRVDPGAIDAVRFEQLATAGRTLLPDDPQAAREQFRAALALVRGEPYADVAFASFAQPEIRRLDELRMRTLEDRVAADLACGDHAAVVGELERLVAENPLRERMRGQLMTALYRTGRQADALRVYGEGRRLLAEELGIDPSPELQQLEGWILRQDSRLHAAGPGAPATRNPYKGLRPFGEQDGSDFFGREALVRRLLDRLAVASRTGGFLAVVGPSGSGKSSVVRAGLLPALRAGALPGSERWSMRVMLPGAHPGRELAAALGADGSEPAGPDVGTVLAGAASRSDPRLVLVVDQAEELFTLVADEGERSRFLDGLVAGLATAEGRLLVVVAVRADCLEGLLRAGDMGELVRTGSELVTPLSRDEMQRAIECPAAAVGVTLEPGLAAEIIADVRGRPGALPLLQYALTDLFERRAGHELTRSAYAAIGGALGALARRAEEVYGAFDAASREVARQVFLHLVVASPSGDASVRRVRRSALLSISGGPRRVDDVIDAFAGPRLLALDRDATTGEAVVEVAHEALLARWPRLAAWVDGARADLWMRHRLADATAEWQASGCDTGYLLVGSRLDLFASWAATTDLDLEAGERGLLDASLDARRRVEEAAAEHAARERALERRAATRLRALAAVLGIGAIVALASAVLALGQGAAAREKAAIAFARELAAASVGNLRADASLSLLLAARSAGATAARGYVVEEALDALSWALQEARVAYPDADVAVAVRLGPAGPRGVPLLPVDELAAMAVSAAGRGLSPGECRAYLHLDRCPTTSDAKLPAGLRIRVGGTTVALDRLASPSMAGTSVSVVSAMPVDLGGLLAAAVDGTDVALTVDAGDDEALLARVGARDLPDIAIVGRPRTVADLARSGLLVDLRRVVDVASLRSGVGDSVVRLGTVAADGAWPAADGSLYGYPVAAEVSSLVWYPAAAFERAGYRVPATLAELDALVEEIVADGRVPWCLGLGPAGDGTSGTEGGAGARVAGATGADFVGDLVLNMAGPTSYDAWTSGSLAFSSAWVRSAFGHLGRLLLADGRVLGGAASAVGIPPALAPLPLLVDPPGCWLYRAAGGERAAMPDGAMAGLAAFPFPPTEARSAGAATGRVYEVVVFSDRPEVRRALDALLGDGPASARADLLAGAGLWPVGAADAEPGAGPGAGADPVAAAERALLTGALATDGFRVDASDLMPAGVDARFSAGVVEYLRTGEVGLSQVLREIQAAWPGADR